VIVDSHVHVFSANSVKYPLSPSAPYDPDPAPLEQLIITMGVSGVDVAVQPQPYGWDNSYLSDSLAASPDRLIGIALVDPRSPDAVSDLVALTRRGRFQGFRLNLDSDDEALWLTDGTADSLWKVAADQGLVVCLQIEPRHAGSLRSLASRFKDVRFVVDHLGKPDVTEGAPYPSFRPILDLADLDGAHIKLSGLFSASKQAFPYQDTIPLVKLVSEAFGARRMLWGTDFPDIFKACGYEAALDHVKSHLPFLSDDDKPWILGKTAATLWNLPDGTAPDLS
jgi:predicted TIM-barrel fold metal-dependent hydrolase